jgi:hypothetical protein
MITSRASNRPSSIQQIQNIKDVFEIFQDFFYQVLPVGENNLIDSKLARVDTLCTKFIELSKERKVERKVEFYNDFIAKCRHYFLMQKEKIIIETDLTKKILKNHEISQNINGQIKILLQLKNKLIEAGYLPNLFDLVDPLLIPKSNKINKPLIPNAWRVENPLILRASTDKTSQNLATKSLLRVEDASRNYSYFESRSEIINDLYDIKNISNPKDNSFFKRYLLKHLELIDLYHKQNNELNDDHQAQLDKYKNQARENCLNYLLSITNPNSQQNFNLDLRDILSSEHNKRYLRELTKLKDKLKGLNYEDKSKRKLDEFLSNEINKVNIELGIVGINSTRSNDSLVRSGSLENYPEREVTTNRRSNLLARFLRGDVRSNRISLSQIPTDHPNKPVASILKSDNSRGKEGRNLSFCFPLGVVPKERLQGYEKLKKIQDKSKFDPLQTIRNSRWHYP